MYLCNALPNDCRAGKSRQGKTLYRRLRARGIVVLHQIHPAADLVFAISMPG